MVGTSGQSNLDSSSSKGVSGAIHEGTGGDVGGDNNNNSNAFLTQTGGGGGGGVVVTSPGNRGANRGLGGGEAGDVKDAPQFPPRHFVSEASNDDLSM